MFVDEVDRLSASISHAGGHRLIACRAVTPLQGRVEIFWAAVARARGAGLELPWRISVQWVDRPRDSNISEGAAWHLACNVIRIYLDAHLPPDRLREVAFRELQIASDFALGLQISRLEMERRAATFTASMMGWNA
jgi:hypothetical protein